MRGFYEFCKVAAPFQFQQYTPPVSKQKTVFPDFNPVLQSVRKAGESSRKIDSMAEARGAYEDAKAISMNKALDNPKSKQAKAMAHNQKLWKEVVEPKVQQAYKKNAENVAQAQQGAKQWSHPVKDVADKLKANPKLQAGLVGGALLAASGITAAKMYKNRQKKKEAERQVAINAYNMQQTAQPSYQQPLPQNVPTMY